MNTPSRGFDDQPGSPLPEGMETCQITGRITPSAEMVEFRGYRVCAEGKMEILRRLRAGMAMPGEMETPTIGSRFVAMMVDGFLLGGLALVVGIIAGYNFFSQQVEGIAAGDDINMFRIQGAANLLMILLGMLYFTVMHGRHGQTLGKMAARIRVVNLDGSPVGYKTAGLRALFYQGLGMLAPIAFLVMDEMAALMMLSGALSIIAGLWQITDVVMALLDRAEQKSLHDRLAATRVVVKS